jgi:hypothetical protein
MRSLNFSIDRHTEMVAGFNGIGAKKLLLALDFKFENFTI